MKCQFLVLCALAAVALAGYGDEGATSYVQDGGRAYGQVHDRNYRTYLDYEQVPVVDAHGVPQDTAEVQAAKAQHFVAHARALVLASKQPSSGQYEGQDDGQYQQQYQGTQGQLYSLQSAQSLHHIHRRGVTYNTPYQLAAHQQPLVPSVTKQGVPIDTPEVQQAKAAHFLAHTKASQGSNSWSFAAGGYPSQQQTSSLVKFGVEHETQGYNTGYSAGAQYSNTGAHTTAGYNSGTHNSGGYSTGAAAYNTGAYNTGAYNTGAYNTGTHSTGAAAYNTGAYNTGAYNTETHSTGAAAYNTGAYNTGAYNTGAYNSGSHSTGAAAYDTGAYTSGGYSNDLDGGYYTTTLTKDGVPEDTPEVKAAKAQHFLALAKAQSASSATGEVQYNAVSPYSQSYGHGQEALPQAPAETPEVQQAKAAHFAAHAAEKARQSKWAPAQAQPVYTNSYSHNQGPHY